MGVEIDRRLTPISDLDPDPFDLVGSKTMSGAFPARMFDLLGRPPWLRQGTRFQALDEFPSQITVREYLTMIGNLHQLGPDPAYYIPLVMAGVPLFAGDLDVAMRFAPDFRSALDLLPKYANERPGFLAYLVSDEAADTTLELRPMTALGTALPALMETWFLHFAMLANRHTGGVMADVRIELAYSRQAHHERLADATGCLLLCDAARNAITFPGVATRRANLVHDAALWRSAVQRCDEDLAARTAGKSIAELRALVADAMNRTGKIPRLADIASQLGLSSRTVIRRLGSHGLRYQGVIDDLLKRRATQLLADPAIGLDRVASETGFSDVSAFHRSFRRWFGTTPAAYRALVQSGASAIGSILLGFAASIALNAEGMEREPGLADQTWLQSSERTSEEEARLRT